VVISTRILLASAIAIAMALAAGCAGNSQGNTSQRQSSGTLSVVTNGTGCPSELGRVPRRVANVRVMNRGATAVTVQVQGASGQLVYLDFPNVAPGETMSSGTGLTQGAYRVRCQTALGYTSSSGAFTVSLKVPHPPSAVAPFSASGLAELSSAAGRDVASELGSSSRSVAALRAMSGPVNHARLIRLAMNIGRSAWLTGGTRTSPARTINTLIGCLGREWSGKVLLSRGRAQLRQTMRLWAQAASGLSAGGWSADRVLRAAGQGLAEMAAGQIKTRPGAGVVSLGLLVGLQQAMKTLLDAVLRAAPKADRPQLAKVMAGQPDIASTPQQVTVYLRTVPRNQLPMIAENIELTQNANVSQAISLLSAGGLGPAG
jgi:hypothetical protein